MAPLPAPGLPPTPRHPCTLRVYLPPCGQSWGQQEGRALFPNTNKHLPSRCCTIAKQNPGEGIFDVNFKQL